MSKRRRWLVGLAAVIVFLIVASFGPDLNVARQRAAARQEGLWVEPEDIRAALRTPPSENAASTIREAIARDRAERTKPSTDASFRAHLGRWRKASAYSKLDFQRPWEASFFPHPETYELTEAIRGFWELASLKHDPEANLVVAARLTRLLQKDPGFMPWLTSLRGRAGILRLAQRDGLTKRIVAELGPPPPLADALRSELVSTLSIQREIRQREGWDILRQGSGLPWRQRLSGLRPFALMGEAETIRLYRGLIRALRTVEGDPKREYDVFMRYCLTLQPHLALYAKGLGPYSPLGAQPGTKEAIVDYADAFKEAESALRRQAKAQ